MKFFKKLSTNYYNKYLKYKQKYIKLKQQIGGELSNVNIYYWYNSIETSKLDINLKDLDADDDIEYIKNRITDYVNNKNDPKFAGLSINNNNIILYKGIYPKCQLIIGESVIENETNYSFKLQNVATSKIPSEIKTGIELDIKTRNGKPYIKLPDGTEYSGEVFNGLPHGFGEETSPNGSKYTGDFIMGEKRGYGQGILYEENGSVYEGELYDGIPHGNGKCIYSDGLDYNGNFTRGLRDGYGEEKFNWNGYIVKYIGNFKNNKLNGNGTYTIEDFGITFNGEFINNLCNGSGIFTIDNDETIEVIFENANVGELLNEMQKLYLVKLKKEAKIARETAEKSRKRLEDAESW